MQEQEYEYILQPLLWTIFGILMEIGITKTVDSQYFAGGILIAAAIIILLVYIIWVKMKFKLLSITDAINVSKVVWGFWYTGGEVVQQQLASSEHIKRVLIPQVENNENTLKFLASLSSPNVDSGLKLIKGQIEALKYSIGLERAKLIVREHTQTFTYAFTIFDKTPVKGNDEYLPCSKNAWIVVQVLEPKVGVGRRHKYAIINKGKDADKFIHFYNLFNSMWENNQPRLD